MVHEPDTSVTTGVLRYCVKVINILLFRLKAVAERVTSLEFQSPR